MTAVDDYTWWTTISGADLTDMTGVADAVWDSALETALDPTTALVSEDLIPVDDLSEDLVDVAFAGGDLPGGDLAGDDFAGDDLAGDDAMGAFHGDTLAHADSDGFDGGDDGFVEL
ncbi:MAG: hypothetical protein ACSLE6_18350 [Mycobacterium sp.]